MFHLRYSKLDKSDYRRILSREFGTNTKSVTEQDKEVLEILKIRQKSVQRRVSRFPLMNSFDSSDPLYVSLIGSS